MSIAVAGVTNADDSVGGLTSLSVTRTVAAGSVLHLFVFVTGDDPSHIGQYTVSDNLNPSGGAWTAGLDAGNYASINALYMQYSLVNTAGGSITVTLTLNQFNETSCQMRLVEITGASTSAALDGHTGNYQATPGAGTDAVTSGAAASAHQPALVLGFTVTGTATIGVGTGFSSNGAHTNAGLTSTIENKRVTTTGSQAATFTETAGADATGTLVAVYDEATTSTGTAVQPSTFERRQTGRAVPVAFDVPPPPIKRAAWLGASEPLRRRDTRPVPFVAEAVPPLAPPPPGPPLAGLALWLKGDAGVTLSGSNVTAWADQSGGGNNATAAGAYPTFNASSVNGLPGITFDGATTYMLGSIPWSPSNAGFSIFYVAKTGSSVNADGVLFTSGTGHPSTTTGTQWGFALCTDAASGQAGWAGPTQLVNLGTVGGGSALANTVYYAGYKYNKSQWSVEGVNTSTPSDTSYPSGSSFNFQIGTQNNGVPSLFFRGDICEILVYDHALTGSDLTAAGAYLNARYFQAPPAGTLAETTPPAWRTPPRKVSFGGEPVKAPPPPSLPPFTTTTDAQWRRFPAPQPASGDVAPGASAPIGAFAETSPPAWRSAPRAQAAISWAPPSLLKLVAFATDAVVSVTRRAARAIATWNDPLPVLPPQTVVVARSPTPPNQVIGLTFTTVSTVTYPTRSQ